MNVIITIVVLFVCSIFGWVLAAYVAGGSIFPWRDK